MRSLPQRVAQLEKGSAADAQILVEALRALIANPIADKQALRDGLKAAMPTSDATVTRAWSECLALPLAGPFPGPPFGAPLVEALTRCPLPDHLKLPLLAEHFDQRTSDTSYRRAALRMLLAHDDPRVRAAGLASLPATWNDSDAQAQATIVGTMTSALARRTRSSPARRRRCARDLRDDGPGHPLKGNARRRDSSSRAKTETDVELAGVALRADRQAHDRRAAPTRAARASRGCACAREGRRRVPARARRSGAGAHRPPRPSRRPSMSRP